MRKSPSQSEKITMADTFAEKLKQAASQTREAQDYNRGMIKYAQLIHSIIKKGTLAEKIETEQALQERDRVNAGDNPKLLKEAEDAIVNFRAGMVVYDRLTTEPAEYRKYAAGFMPKHKTPDGIPKDEMRNVLKSQNSRESQRDSSRHNTEGEEALVAARRALIASILRDYTTLQKTVLVSD